ncbi:MAG TPA: prepilin-type N-terminal cleavage/methylation domain-containing protein [Candidatus Scybalomonas excrementigallinarum]|nr:prepilin-type N-terminal cleavage/methylation domain-containing protein [Candidatus Scybalomonas excrementigallinarum]
MLGSRLKKKIHNEKGFTLAELLVVIAILAILVAISVPILTSRLSEAKKSTDESNIRAAKVLVSSKIMEGTNVTTYYYNADEGKLVTSKADVGEVYGQSSEEVKGATNAPEGKILQATITTSNGDSQIKFSWVAKSGE